jgi:hypothetical protein
VVSFLSKYIFVLIICLLLVNLQKKNRLRLGKKSSNNMKSPVVSRNSRGNNLRSPLDSRNMNSLQENDDENDSQSGLHFAQQLEEGRRRVGELLSTHSPEKANETLEVEPTTALSSDPPLASSSLGSVKDNNNNDTVPLVQRMSFSSKLFSTFFDHNKVQPQNTGSQRAPSSSFLKNNQGLPMSVNDRDNNSDFVE